ncbi:hypothetical protein D5086_017804 [Populus alba]|uniref:Uncharacterized protein n=1 Tax=Populus alba TaxID=43335 RepID=A0ACC4BPA7_POPAL
MEDMAEVELNPYQKQAFSPCPSEHVLQAADRKTSQGKKCVAVMSKSHIYGGYLALSGRVEQRKIPENMVSNTGGIGSDRIRFASKVI